MISALMDDYPDLLVTSDVARSVAECCRALDGRSSRLEWYRMERVPDGYLLMLARQARECGWTLEVLT